MRRIRQGSVALATAMVLATAGGAAGHPLGGAPSRLEPPYRCRVAATKLGPTITVAFRMNSVPDRAWHIRLWHEGKLFFSWTQRTDTRGRYQAERATSNDHGRDLITAQARSRVTGATCDVTLRI